MVDSTKLLNSFEDDTLREICFWRKLDADEGESKKNIIKKIAEDVTNLGVTHLVRMLKREDLVGMAEPLGLETKSKTKTALSKRIAEEMHKGVSATLEKAATVDTLKTILKDYLEIDASDVPDKKKELIDTLANEIDAIGLEVILGNLPSDALRAMCDRRKLKVESDSKNIMIDSLINDTNYKPPSPKKPEKVSKKKPKIEMGVSKTDLNSWYYRYDLAKWCEDHDLKGTGTKKELIVRVLAKLEGREEPKKGKKRKAAALKKRPAKKAKIAKKTEKTDKAEKAEKADEKKKEEKKKAGGKKKKPEDKKGKAKKEDEKEKDDKSKDDDDDEDEDKE